MEKLLEIFQQNIPFWIFVLGMVLLTFIEVSKIKLNPWSALGRLIGKVVNSAMAEQIEDVHTDIQAIKKEVAVVSDEVKSVKEDVSNVKVELDNFKKNTEVREMDGIRANILRFNEELIHDSERSYTEEYFNQMLEFITDYEKYCDEHKEYENKKAVLAIKNIQRVYEKCVVNNTFLS